MEKQEIILNQIQGSWSNGISEIHITGTKITNGEGQNFELGWRQDLNKWVIMGICIIELAINEDSSLTLHEGSCLGMEERSSSFHRI